MGGFRYIDIYLARNCLDCMMKTILNYNVCVCKLCCVLIIMRVNISLLTFASKCFIINFVKQSGTPSLCGSYSLKLNMVCKVLYI